MIGSSTSSTDQPSRRMPAQSVAIITVSALAMGVGAAAVVVVLLCMLAANQYKKHLGYGQAAVDTVNADVDTCNAIVANVTAQLNVVNAALQAAPSQNQQDPAHPGEWLLPGGWRTVPGTGYADYNIVSPQGNTAVTCAGRWIVNGVTRVPPATLTRQEGGQILLQDKWVYSINGGANAATQPLVQTPS